MRSRLVRTRLRWWLFAPLVVGCAPEPVSLTVDLRTDLVPGVEFAAVETAVDAVPGVTNRTEVAAGDPFGRGTRVAEFPGLGVGTQAVHVTLLNRAGAPVASRTLLMVLETDTLVTAIVTRNCLGIDCGETASCLGGRCVDPRCVRGDEPECMPECGLDADCPAAPDCASSRCAGGLCLFQPDDSLCAADRYCQPACGCAPVPTFADPPVEPTNACVPPPPPPPTCELDCASLPNVASARCEGTVCVIEACDSLADCNGDPADGCEAAPSWDAVSGGDHCGNDWVPDMDAEVGGTHVGVGRFEVTDGITLTVRPLTDAVGGSFELEAREVLVAGVIDATGAGHLGGRGGDGRRSGSPYCGGGGAAGAAGQGDDAGGGGGGGSGHGGSRNDEPGCRDADGGRGNAGRPGGYAGSEGNHDTSTDDAVFVGSGGGGGGGGGSGSRFGNNNNFPAGTGGGGGAGGRGGGVVRLTATSELTLRGSLRTRGERQGGNGGGGAASAGCERYQDPNGGSGGDPNGRGSSAGGAGRCQDFRACGGGFADTCGGAGGAGGAGAGGGVLLRAPRVEVTGDVDAAGGSDASNGGTLKIRACEYTPGTYSAGRVHEATLPDCS